MKTTEDSGVPEFQSLEEERKYWEGRGALAEGHKGSLNKPRPGQKRSSFLAVRLTGEELTRLRDVAADKGMGPSTFARVVLSEAIEQKSMSPASKTLGEVMQALAGNLPAETRDRMESILKAIAMGEPPILLQLSDKRKLEEFSYFAAAALLSFAGGRVATPENEKHQEADESLDQMDEKVRRQSFASSEELIQMSDDILLHINHGMALLSGHKHDRGLNLLSFLLINHAFNSLWRAREDAVTGYPVQSLTLCRAALEDWATLRWVEIHPETADRWLWAILPELQRPKVSRPRFEKIWKKLGDDGLIPSQYYDALSKFAHPMSIGLGWLVHFDPANTYFHCGGHFDPEDLITCLSCQIELGQAFFERVAQVQFRMLGSVERSWLERGKQLTNQAEVLLKGTSAQDSSSP